jgi:hypothetical protein
MCNPKIKKDLLGADVNKADSGLDRSALLKKIPRSTDLLTHSAPKPR